MRFASSALLLVVLAAGCRPATVAPSAPAPMEPALRQHLATVADDTPVDVFVGLGATAPDVARRDLEAAGVEVRLVAGDVAVVRGVRAAVRRVAALPWVTSLELSQERPPLPERPGSGTAPLSPTP